MHDCEFFQLFAKKIRAKIDKIQIKNSNTNTKPTLFLNRDNILEVSILLFEINSMFSQMQVKIKNSFPPMLFMCKTTVFTVKSQNFVFYIKPFFHF